MSIPVWQSQGGDLGKISTQNYYQYEVSAVSNIVADSSAIVYLGGVVHPNGHSKILGFALDGYPIYGPFGYSKPLDTNSAIRRMNSGWSLRNSSHRFSAAADLYTYPMGVFVDDYQFVGGTDLDRSNGRYCITPDYPNGTYAYFCTVDKSLSPVFPYVLGDRFYGDPTVAGHNTTVNDGGVAPTTYKQDTVTKISNYDGTHSSWQFANGLVTLTASGLPYHSYGHKNNYSAINSQNYNQTFSLRAGTNTAGTNASMPAGIVGYWLNGVAIQSVFAIANNPLNYNPAPGNYRYDVLYAFQNQPNFTFYADDAGGLVDNTRYYYAGFGFRTAWQTGSGGGILQAALPCTLEVISGSLPPGLQLNAHTDPNTGVKTWRIEGIPVNTSVDSRYDFTVRATSLTRQISDQAFYVVTTGNLPPQFLSTTEILGDYQDCKRVDINLNVADFNTGDNLTYTIDASRSNLLRTDGLPPGLELTSDGHLRGILQPINTVVPKNSTGTDIQPGFGVNQFGVDYFNGDTNISKKSYLFAVSVTDGKVTVRKQYQINVISTKNLTSAVDQLSVDSQVLTTDATPKHNPILLTTELGTFATARSGEYFNYQFTGIDFDGDPIRFAYCGSDAGWDQQVYDSGFYEGTDFGFPYGLYLDDKTGWLTGRIPVQEEPTQTYTFGVMVYKMDAPQYNSGCNIFTITVLGTSNTDIVWQTAADLGDIENGKPSQISVAAVAANGEKLYYTLVSGSRIPEGCRFIGSGDLIGRPGFQHFYLDHGKTTIDGLQLASNYITDPTTWDHTYEFTVRASNVKNTIESYKKFHLRVTSNSYEPTENLYLVCRPPAVNRRLLIEFLGNTDIFNPADIYRPNDPYYGCSKELRMLTGAGLSAAQTETYIAAMQPRHRTKTFYFGEFRSAQAKDIHGNHIYDVIYVDMIDTAQSPSGALPESGPVNLFKKSTNWRNPRVADLPENQLTVDNSVLNSDWFYVKAGDTWYPVNNLNLMEIPNVRLMTNDLLLATGVSTQNTLPEWMATKQPDGRIPGFTLAAVVAYMKPGTADRCLFNLRRFMPADIRSIGWQSDRYVLENNLSANFDLQNYYWPYKDYTTFDDVAQFDKEIIPDYTVDFALDIPFNVLNSSNLADVQLMGGLDGVEFSDRTQLQGKTVIFSTQQNYSGYTSMRNNGWIFRDNTLVPGFYDKSASVQNQQAGIWRIEIDSRDQMGWDPAAASWDELGYDSYNTLIDNLTIRLVFVTEVQLDQIVAVSYGQQHGNSYMKYSGTDYLSKGLTVPYYVPQQQVRKVGVQVTSFDKNGTRFITGVDCYADPLADSQYLKFPVKDIFIS
jgi:hypothetical protein